MHSIAVARYLGRGSRGTKTLREELEAENEGIRIPSPIGWLSGAHSVKARHHEGTFRATSVVLAVSDENTVRLVRKNELRLQCCRYEIESFQEDQMSDAVTAGVPALHRLTLARR